MESQWDSQLCWGMLPPEMQEVAETRDKMSKIIDKMKGRELSGILCRNRPLGWLKRIYDVMDI